MTPDLDPEQAVIATLVQAPETLNLVPWLTGDEFERPRNRTVFRAVQAAVNAPGALPAPDSFVVLDALQTSGETNRDHALGAYVGELVGDPRTAVPNVTWYATQLAVAARRRRLTMLAAQLQAAAGDPARDLDDLARLVADSLHVATELTRPIDDTDQDNLDGFTDLEDLPGRTRTDYDWVIPGLLARQERVVVVAGEGAGKTTLMRAVTTAVAAGRHPLDPMVRIPAKRTLLVDLENPPDLIDVKTSPMMGYLRHLNAWPGHGHAYGWFQPGGIDLRRPRDAYRLELAVRRARPDLVLLGPLYKAYSGAVGKDAEACTAEAAAVLDRLRQTYGLTYWLEHHAPVSSAPGVRDLRPIGTSYWLRWPEFGLALRKDRDHDGLAVEHWRGQRDEREWPDLLHRGQHGWPWTATWNEGMPRWMLRQET